VNTEPVVKSMTTQ